MLSSCPYPGIGAALGAAASLFVMMYERLMIGTSAWGSRLGISEAVILARQAFAKGFRNFDTAPTYGAGYSELVLGRAFAGNHDVRIATKFGQLNETSVRGLAKKIFRAPGVAGFLSSFQPLSINDRTAPAFWSEAQALRSLSRSEQRLENSVRRFFLHSPPIPLLESGLFKDASRFAADIGTMRMGISQPCRADLDRLRSGIGQSLELLQMPVDRVIADPVLVQRLREQEVWLNGLFRCAAPIEREHGIARDALTIKLKELFKASPRWGIVVGINSTRSLDRLPDIYDTLFS